MNNFETSPVIDQAIELRKEHKQLARDQWNKELNMDSDASLVSGIDEVHTQDAIAGEEISDLSRQHRDEAHNRAEQSRQSYMEASQAIEVQAEGVKEFVAKNIGELVTQAAQEAEGVQINSQHLSS